MSKKMPFSLDAEQSVLGVAFLNSYEIDRICEEMNVDMFFDPRNKLIYNAICELNRNKTPLDITTIKYELEKVNVLDKVGLDYLVEVIDSVITSSNIEHYMNIVKSNAIRRNLIESAASIAEEAYVEDDLNTLLDNSEKVITNVAKARSVGDFLPIRHVLKDAQEKLEERSKNKNLITGLETGFYDFDKVTTGFQGGEFIILAARPGIGKTSLSLNMATYAASTTEKAIAIFNLEMPAEMLVNRMISSIGQIDSYKLSTGNMHENDWKRYNEAIMQLGETNIYIEDNAGITSPEIRAKCRRLANSEKGLGFVLIDYLQLVSTGNKRIESRQVEVSEISRSLKTMALELNVPVLALAQLSRNAERRENNKPMLADLRESGSLEQDADMVLFINKDTETEETENIIPAELQIAKHRKGNTAGIKLLFEKNTTTFKNVLNAGKGEN